MRRILGLSAYYHDSAAAIIIDGEIAVAAEEERFSRLKHDSRFPVHSVAFCLRAAGLKLNDLDAVVFYDKPFLKFERLFETYLDFVPFGFGGFAASASVWLKEKLFFKQMLRSELKAFSNSKPLPPLLFCEHHHSHAASAFFPSPFESAAVLCMDGVGEWTTTSIWHGRGASLKPIAEIHFPHSLGLLYSAFTGYAGFKVNSGEYKLMGLAPYGKPRFRELILSELIDVKDDGSFRLNMKYFDFATGTRMTNARFHRLFGGLPRLPETPFGEREADLAASVQSVLEAVVLKLAQTAKSRLGEKKLCLSGGVALNCVANGALLRSGLFDDIWIQPAAGDSGGALGCALACHHQWFNEPRRPTPDAMKNAYLGPEEGASEMERTLRRLGAVFQRLDEHTLIDNTAASLETGKVIGWFSGRMEFGPRALGSRSILADPRPPDMRQTLNEKIKLREGFRPFAPIVAADSAHRYFELDRPSPYMLLVARVRDGMDLPSITHVDRSARVQTITPEANPRMHALLKAFRQRTGIDVLVNTSFNVRGEPIVCSSEDAYRCFMHSDLDILVIGDYWLEKNQQPPGKWERQIDLD